MKTKLLQITERLLVKKLVKKELSRSLPSAKTIAVTRLKREQVKLKMKLKLTALAILSLALTAVRVQAALTYNSGGVVEVNTDQTDPSPGLTRVEVSNGTTLNWATGASYLPTANYVNPTTPADEWGFLLSDTAVLNLTGGNLTATESDASVGISFFGHAPGNYGGAVTMSGGTFSITESGTGQAVGFLLETNGLTSSTLNISAGTMNITEGGSGNARVFDISGGARVNVTISGGNFNLTEAGNGSTKFFHIAGANTISTVLVTGGNFIGSQLGSASDTAQVFDMGSAMSELWLRGGNFSGSLSNNVVDNGAVYLFGEFDGVEDGVYTDANWIDGTILGGTLELGGTLTGVPTDVNNLGRLYINVIPEPTVLAVAGAGLLAILALRKRA